MSKKPFFQDHWLYEPAFNSWLEKVNNDLRLFQCKFCNSQNSLSNMGKRAIISHMEGKKQKFTKQLHFENGKKNLFSNHLELKTIILIILYNTLDAWSF